MPKNSPQTTRQPCCKIVLTILSLIYIWIDGLQLKESSLVKFSGRARSVITIMKTINNMYKNIGMYLGTTDKRSVR